MSSPAKRRKISHVTSQQPVRSLDFFFGKKQLQKIAEQDAVSEQSSVNAAQATKEDAEALNDEQFARKLQEEWNRESNVTNGTARQSPSPPDPIAVLGDESFSFTGDPDAVEPTPKCPGHDALTYPSKTRDIVPEDDPQPKDNTLSLRSATAAEDVMSTTIPFDQSPLTFDPDQYISNLQTQWALEGGGATYALLTRCFVLVNSTQSRIKIVDTLVNLLRVIIEGDPESLLPAVSTFPLSRLQK